MEIYFEGIRKIQAAGLEIVRKCGETKIESLNHFLAWKTHKDFPDQDARDRYYDALMNRDTVIEGRD